MSSLLLLLKGGTWTREGVRLLWSLTREAMKAKRPSEISRGRGIIEGFPDGRLLPFGGATRAQVVKIIVYFMDKYGF